MQKLISNTGSTLVAVVVFAIVLAIGAAGYMHVMSNTAGHEVDALNEEKAFLTAESGLLIGINWLESNLEAASNFTTALTEIYQQSAADNPNKMALRVYIENKSADENKPSIHVISRAENDELPYTKELRAIHDPSPQTPALVIDSLPQDQKDGLLFNMTFDGYVHFNTPIKMKYADEGSQSGVRFLGPVSVFCDTNVARWGADNGSPEDYRFGVYMEPSKYGELGTTFKSSYYAPWDEITMQTHLIPDGSENEVYSLDDFMELYLEDDPDNDPNTTIEIIKDSVPILRFTQSGTVVLHYYNSGKGWESSTVLKKDESGNYTAINIDGKVILTSYNIGVMGVVAGNVTVQAKGDETTPPFIRVVGDLVYDHFDDPRTSEEIGDLDYFANYNDSMQSETGKEYIDETNFGIYSKPDEHTSLITLVSASHIEIGDTSNQDIYKYTYNKDTKELEFDSKDAKDKTTLFLTAFLITESEKEGLLFVEKNDVIDPVPYHFTLRFIGAVYIDTWSSYYSGGSSRLFYLYNDRRINNNGLYGPGIPPVTGGITNNIRLLRGTWRDTNITPKIELD